MSDIKRLNYFIGQFLTADDFRDEQAYQIGQRRRANRLRFGPGILDGGFLVKPGQTVDSIEVGPGTAIDREGQEIVLLDPVTLNIAAASAGEHYLVVFYKEEQDVADKRKDGDFEGAIRVTERTKIELRDALPSGEKVGLELVVARITVTVDAAGQRQVVLQNDDPLGQPLRQPSRLRSLDTDEAFVATIRAADLWFGYSGRSGRPKRALVDVGKTPMFGDTLANKNGLIINYGDSLDPGWDYVMVKGDLVWGSGSALTANQHGSLELGGGLYNIGSTRTPYIDFHYKDGEDFNARIINDADGLLSIVAPKLYAAGKVGIGTTTPSSQLVVGDNFGATVSGGPGGGAVFGTNLATSDGAALFTPYTHGGNYGYAGIFARWGQLSFYTNNANTVAGQAESPEARLHIDASGKVGIGTTTPSAQLDVKGDIAVTGTVDGRDISADGARLDSHVGNTSNPHATTAAQIGALPSIRRFDPSSYINTDQEVKAQLAGAENGSIVMGVAGLRGDRPEFRIYYKDQQGIVKKLTWDGVAV